MRNALKALACLFALTDVSAPPIPVSHEDSREVSPALFASLEELARLVDISYCVGSTGIHKPFQCLSRCGDFQGFELVTVRYSHPFHHLA